MKLTMDHHALSLHLQSLDELTLRNLYNELYEICTGRRLETSAELKREIIVIETTDAERGWFHRELLGRPENLNDQWLPSSYGSIITPNDRIRYKSNAKQKEPLFQRKNRIFPSCVVSEQDAEREIRSRKLDQSSSISITANFPKWPTGWSLWSTPPISPREPITDQKLQGIGSDYWILVCRNYTAAHNLVSQNLECPPILAVIDEPENNDPTHSGNIRVVSRSEAAALLLEFCARSEVTSMPDKQRLIKSIKKIYSSAVQINNQAKSERKQQRHLHLKLRLAKNAWEKMFIDERESAINALRIKAVAYPMHKTMLIMRGEREAHVNGYMRERLLPLIKNFISRECIKIELQELEQQSKIPLPPEKIVNQSASELRAGFLYALPSIGLLIPNIPISLTTLYDLAEKAIPTTASDSAEVSQSLLSNVSDSWYTPEWAKDIGQSMKQLIGDFKEFREGVIEQLEIMNSGIASIIGILVAGQIAVVIGLLIGSMIMIRGSMSLRVTEDMIKEILDKTESMWTQIENSLRRIMPALNGVVDNETLQRSDRVLKIINNI